MKIGYIRVSTLDQNLERQTEVMKSEGAERIFQDKASGKNNDRPQLKKMLESLRSGDVVIVKSVDRMARSYSAFYLIWEEIKEKGASLRVVDLGMTLDNSPMTAFLVSIMAAVAELERGMIRERQKEGVKIAKEKGVLHREKAGY
ncbi:Putative transposon Tn552 DNA-invertase bin3 [Serratia quinivorans]|uniref:Transposon Tn552 DNA-invertase bin3 n=1 Tax=Serratia quinivorans TaxID=137545 RepID=A0A380AV29_9GAMM|nr:Putative transposon Tn552 DNA-invertase bin3 [Serratia quinivorans]